MNAIEAEKAMILANARAIVARIEGGADDEVTAAQTRALARQLAEHAKKTKAQAPQGL